ncbi:hypothetical protein LX36DRAFT_372842 [Colletotrichum falcatum]|nr:hypothetical protein LX36DRAFT_372842 [Colletotrichum falcatum]
MSAGPESGRCRLYGQPLSSFVLFPLLRARAGGLGSREKQGDTCSQYLFNGRVSSEGLRLVVPRGQTIPRGAWLYRLFCLVPPLPLMGMPCV